MFKLFFPKRSSKKLLILHYVNGSLCHTKFTVNLKYKYFLSSFFKLYKMTFIVGHNNKCHIICCEYSGLFIYLRKKYKYDIKLHILCVTALNVILVVQKLWHLTKNSLY